MIKSILVPLDASDYSKAATSYAIQIAKKIDAIIVGLSVIDIKLINGPILRDLSLMSDSFGTNEYREELSSALKNKSERIIEAFEKQCKKAKTSYKSIIETGLIAETIVKKSHLTDLVVMGKRGENGEWASPFLGSVVENVVRMSSKAVIVVPKEEKSIENILVAYDGSSNANRAISMLTDLSELGKFQITVLTVSDNGNRENKDMEEGISFLRERGLEANGMILEGDVVRQIVKATNENEVDILVMGAYGKSMFRELLLGSTTTQVLRQVEIPVLLYR